jgi:hypothetical protein
MTTSNHCSPRHSGGGRRRRISHAALPAKLPMSMLSVGPITAPCALCTLDQAKRFAMPPGEAALLNPNPLAAGIGRRPA